MEKEIKKIVDRILSEEIKNTSNRIKNRIHENSGMCSECGGAMYEGECMECGSMYEGDIQELGGMDDGHPRFGKKNFSNMSKRELDSMIGMEDMDLRGFEPLDDIDMDLGKFKPRRDIDMDLGKLKPRRDRDMEIDFKEIDEDEVEEGNEFSGELAKAREAGKKTFTVDGKTYPVKETYYRIDGQGNTLFTENEMIDIIEKIIKEDKLKDAKVATSNVLKSSLNKSGKEEGDYIEMVTKKMKEYLKTGSKGKYEMNPKHFPKGNGELEEMEKMAYIPSDAVKDFTKNLTAAALENLDYDGINADEDWVTDNIEGSSRTGNNPEWANAVETDVNKDRNKIRKDNMLAKIKRQAYNKAPQPVTDKSGNKVDKGDQILMKLESVEEKEVLSEITKMKNLIGYKQKTQ